MNVIPYTKLVMKYYLFRILFNFMILIITLHLDFTFSNYFNSDSFSNCCERLHRAQPLISLLTSRVCVNLILHLRKSSSKTFYSWYSHRSKMNIRLEWYLKLLLLLKDMISLDILRN